ncbi:hypothetical protein PVAP13_2KG363511 [Panicum virgatum]|uniref:Uncharacterized protein n=1 Tax=Panicum virgatum TaxID=38727 RepID=A0A8T0WC56_PANVG|nr:hypothetical protein PVAP13_2KG363511 [Panicum virgatum]
MGQRMRAQQPKLQHKRDLSGITPIRIHTRIHDVHDRTLAPMLSHPVSEHDAVADAVLVILLDGPSSAGDLQQERPKGEDVGRRGWLAGVAQFRGEVPYGAHHMRGVRISSVVVEPRETEIP